MLTQLREGSTGSIMIFVLFGMLIFVFIFFFGPQSQGFQPGSGGINPSGIAATIEGQKIPVQQVEMLVRRTVQYGGDVSSEDLPRLRRDALAQTIDQVALEQRARALGIAASEDDVSKYIVSADNPDFRLFTNRDGKFDYDLFQSRVTQGLGSTTKQYRVIKERELVIRRYLDFLASQIKVSTPEVRGLYNRRNRKWELEYIKFTSTDFDKAPAPTTAQGIEYAKANADAVKTYYDKNKATYDRDLEVKIRRVTIKLPKGATDAQKAEARKKLEAILVEAKAPGADLAKIATEKSEDYYAKQGGDMGWQAKGRSADYALFAQLKKGEFTKIQDASFGLWFARAEELKPAIHKSLADVSPEIGVILAGKANRKTAALARAKVLFNRAKAGTPFAQLHPIPPKLPTPSPVVEDGEEGEAPEAPEEKTSAPPPSDARTVGPFSEERISWDTIPGIGKSPELARALSTLTTEKPLVQQVIEVGDDAFIVRLKNRVEPTDEGFKAEKDKLTAQLQQQRRAQIFGAWEALIFGQTRQRELMRRFGGALLAQLPSSGGIENLDIDTKAYPISAMAPATK